MLIDDPVEEPLNQEQMRAGHCWRFDFAGIDDLQHIMLGDFADRSIPPRCNEDGAQNVLDVFGGTLPWQLLINEILRDLGERMLDAQRRLTRCRLTLCGLDHTWVEALVDL